MAEETRTIEKLTITAKAALLEAITSAADKPTTVPEKLESLARAYAAVAGTGPVKGDLTD